MPISFVGKYMRRIGENPRFLFSRLRNFGSGEGIQPKGYGHNSLNLWAILQGKVNQWA